MRNDKRLCFPGGRYFHLWWICVVGWLGCARQPSGERQVFRYNQSEGIATLDPAFARNEAIQWATHQLFNTLVETDTALHLVPSLAARWEVSADQKRYTFFLRRSVFFQDDPCFPGGRGRLLKASDVVFSLRRLMDPATASPGAWIFQGHVDPDTGFRAPDDSTFVLTLTQPFRPILGILSMEYCSVIPPEAIQRYGADFRRHPVGTGPFRIDSWDEGQALILVRNAHYFEKGLPHLDAVKITFLDSKATEFLEFLQGQLDMVNDIDPAYKDEVLTRQGTLRPEWNGKIVLSRHAQLDMEYLGILVDTASPLVKASPLRLEAVRQAINMAFDRRKMLLYLRNSIGIPAEHGFVPPALPGFGAVPGYTYAPDKASALLTAAGFSGGAGLPVIHLLTIPTYADLASFIARQEQEVGIRIQVEVVQKSLLLEETAKSQALFFRGSWVADYPDAENFLSVFYSKNPAPPNYTRFHDTYFDRLYEQALAERDSSSRSLLYNRMDSLVMTRAPVVPLWYDEALRLVRPGVQGLYPNGLNLLELRYCYKAAHFNK
ncbi:ABC transporter substrate-binding protein [Dinghuibacter silviterrae]|uniref:Peptide/nickel transport system substrate-binding protein n=1 Tax=Dinghuibacter silviterrae TaxID=1539049 RepID=A0A4R8DSI0_9BACT|nr:ABC transporter substrate-binding protein [Dinghuibacter silviterrae]TDX01180.1 peptide/nickel transport system substrate-binding protein [Dinghuibacter silviterrae]